MQLLQMENKKCIHRCKQAGKWAVIYPPYVCVYSRSFVWVLGTTFTTEAQRHVDPLPVKQKLQFVCCKGTIYCGADFSFL